MQEKRLRAGRLTFDLHPLLSSLDTIKTKLQTAPRPAPGQAPLYSGALDATRKVCGFSGVGG